LSAGDGGRYQATIEATFGAPLLGTGEEVIEEMVLLSKLDHPDFTSP
jgi:hypothetical protein